MPPRVLERAEHPLSRRLIDPEALKILYRLHHAGFKAFLVGGGVRDLLSGRTPKDFDIATTAHPAQIRRLFRNSRVIGRRFRLVHVFYRDKIVEVSTFRGQSNAPEGEVVEDVQLAEPVVVPESAGRKRKAPASHENFFGTPEEDARRRDFTVNGLFYDISNFSVIDFVGGLEDLEARLLRTIGDPHLRFVEDPVRMVRAVEFAARLGFAIEAETYNAILEHHGEILRAAPARLIEEILELLRRGAARRSFELLAATGLLADILPDLERNLRPDPTAPPPGDGIHPFWALLDAADAVYQDTARTAVSHQGLPPRIADTLLLTLLFWPLVEAVEANARADGQPLSAGDRLLAVDRLVTPGAIRLALSTQHGYRIKQALLSLPRVERGPQALRGWKQLARKPYFADTLQLLELLAAAGLGPGQEARAWREQLAADPLPAPEEEPEAPRRRRRRGKPHEQASEELQTGLQAFGGGEAAESGGEGAGHGAGASSKSESDPAKPPVRRRRRGGSRRRRGASGSATATARKPESPGTGSK